MPAKSLTAKRQFPGFYEEEGFSQNADFQIYVTFYEFLDNALASEAVPSQGLRPETLMACQIKLLFRNCRASDVKRVAGKRELSVEFFGTRARVGVAEAGRTEVVLAGAAGHDAGLWNERRDEPPRPVKRTPRPRARTACRG